MASKNPFEVMMNEAPGVWNAYNELYKELLNGDGIDEKTWQLIYIGIRASQGEVGSVCGHTVVAKKAGATRAEIRDAILVTFMSSGVRGAFACLGPALEAYDNAQ